MLASRGKLDLDAPVIELWPEFGQNGKERVTTRMMLDHSAGVPALRDEGEGHRSLRMGLHDGAAGRRGAVLGARHAQRLSRLHLRLDGRRDGAARLGQVARHVLPGRGRQAARARFLDRPARGDRAARRADDPVHLQAGADQDAVHDRPRRRCRRRPPRCSSSMSAPGAPAAPTRAKAMPPRSARPTASPMRAGWPACTRRWRRAAASWSTARRWPAWARSRWRRMTTPPCASRRALRSAS